MCLSSKFHFLPVSLLLRRQSETVYRDGERDGQRGEVSGRPQPKVSGQLPRLAPALQPQPQKQQLPALPPRFGAAQLCSFTPAIYVCVATDCLFWGSGFDSNCCNGVTSNKSHSSSPHSHKPCPPGSGPALPTSDISLNGSRSQQPITRY